LILHNTSNSRSSSLPNNASLIHVAPQQCEKELYQNAVSQQDTCQKINSMVKNISKYEQIYLISTNNLFKNTLALNIIKQKSKKLEESIIKKYNEPRRLLAAMIHSDFWNKIHTKVGLDILTVGYTFKTIQTINEPILVADHNFLSSFRSTCNILRPEYFVGTTSLTYISNLKSIFSNQQFAAAIIKKNKVKPVWVLLVDRGPNENSKHMKNIS
ncbi:8203_t:CDS:2, partial [Gigaspora margarita]